jgi:hypothetical protein
LRTHVPHAAGTRQEKHRRAPEVTPPPPRQTTFVRRFG